MIIKNKTTQKGKDFWNHIESIAPQRKFVTHDELQQRQSTAALTDLETCRVVLAKYLGPIHPIMVELQKIIENHKPQEVMGGK